MTRVPMGTPTVLPAQAGLGTPWTDRITNRYGVKEFSQFIGAHMMVEKYGFERDDLDAFSLRSHQLAAAATQAGVFNQEVVPLEVQDADGNTSLHVTDEGIRYDRSEEHTSELQSIMRNTY